MSEAGTLRAMVRNYRMNNLWDHLDAEACTKAANKIDELTKQRDELLTALIDILSTNASKHGTQGMMLRRCIEIATDALSKLTALIGAQETIEWMRNTGCSAAPYSRTDTIDAAIAHLKGGAA